MKEEGRVNNSDVADQIDVPKSIGSLSALPTFDKFKANRFQTSASVAQDNQFDDPTKVSLGL